MIKQSLTTFFLLTGLGLLLVSMGYLIGGTSGMTIAFIMALVINGISFFFGDSIVLTMMGAQPLDRATHGSIFDTTEALCQEMSLPMPRMWLIPSQTANAFATGRSPVNGSVAISSGLLALLQPHEVRGVIAHELAHIKNRDILIATIAATLATAVSYLGHMIQRMLFWRALSNDSRNRDQGNPIGLLIGAILMPLAAMIVQLAISRSREYLADETGALASHDPLALASALEKLHAHTQHGFAPAEPATQSISSLFIVHPFSGESLMNLFSTHPPVHKRIARLHALCEKRF